jgi:ParB/RepB/Spo0J family partition protein
MMANLSGAVHKTMNFVFSDIESSTNSDNKKRIDSLKANIGKIATIPIDEIETNKNIRKKIDMKSEGFLRLVESIKKYGILENIVVELKIDNDKNSYKLVCVAGHRRILAAKIAKTVVRVPCLLQSYSEKGDSIGAALAENLNREDLHCLDVAEGYCELLKSGWTEEDLSKHFCRDIRTIRHYIKMAGFSDEAKNRFRENPDIFSTRVIMRQFAYRKYSSQKELKDAIEKCLIPVGPKKKPKKIQAISEVSIQPDKKSLKSALSLYLSKQNLLSEVIKEEIRRAFIELKLI